MDFVFIGLVSMGFVGGIINGLKKTSIKFLKMFLSMSLTFLITPVLVKLFARQEFLKTEIYSFLRSNFAQNNELLTKGDFLREIIQRFCQISNKTNFADAFFNVVYKTIITVLVFAVMFLIVYCLISLISFFCLRIKIFNNQPFFTNRFLGGFIGGINGVVIFVFVSFALYYLYSLTGISSLQTVLDSSSVISFEKEFLEKNISAYISGIY